jgi:hypothetical protein
MKETGTALRSPIRLLLTAVVLQVFRGIVTPWYVQLLLATTVTGGVLRVHHLNAWCTAT